MTGPGPAGNPSRWRDYALMAGLLAFVILGLVALAAATGWEETMTQVKRLTWSQVGILLLLSLCNYLARGLRWHLFARRLAPQTRLIQNLRHFLGGLAMAVTPGRLGELVRMRWLNRETGIGFERAAPLMLVDRATDLSAMALLLAISIALSATGITGAVPVAVLALVAAYVSTRAGILMAITTFAYRLIGRLPRLFARLRRAVRALALFTTPGVLSIATLIGCLGWFAEGYAFWLLLTWMGAETGLAAAIGIFVFSTLAGSATGAPGGVGGAEAAMVALLSLDGIPLDVSIPATAIIRLTTLWFAILIGLMVFPMAERQSAKVGHALERN